jgi:TetR/AcrR family transcriptional regulator
MKKTMRATRVEKEQAIVREAEAQFARYGFEGATLERIGAAVGISRHSLLYYFASKEALYRRVLDDVMAQWLAGMSELTEHEPSDDPALALRRYIAAKLASSRERRDGTGVFTKEVMAGAPIYGDAITSKVLPVLRADVRAFKRWAKQGRIAPLNYTHLMFAIWAVTQAYADLGPQFALLLGKKSLDKRDFAAAQQVIEAMVLSALDLRPPAA